MPGSTARSAPRCHRSTPANADRVTAQRPHDERVVLGGAGPEQHEITAYTSYLDFPFVRASLVSVVSAPLTSS
ncbi:MAG: hypothetical protein ACRCZD_10520 [Phycicoccus sp.]